MAADGFESHATRTRPNSRIGLLGRMRVKSHARSRVTIVPPPRQLERHLRHLDTDPPVGRVYGRVHEPVDRDESEDDQDRTEGPAGSSYHA